MKYYRLLRVLWGCLHYMTQKIDANTVLLGLFASPCRHSVSPLMHNSAFERLGINCVYLSFEVDDGTVEAAVNAVRTLGMRGVNVSMPNKREIVQYMDRLSPAAEIIGAVNTVVNDDGVLTGHNTDGTGFIQSLRDAGIDFAGRKLVLAGAGGAGTAIAVQAALDGFAEISFFNRRNARYEKAARLAEVIDDRTDCQVTMHDLNDREDFRRELATADVYCDATSLGMKPMEDMSLVEDPAWFHEDMAVCDIVYAPRTTKLMNVAQQAGVRHVINGLGMLLNQGAAAFELWTGQKMPLDYVRSQVFGEV